MNHAHGVPAAPSAAPTRSKVRPAASRPACAPCAGIVVARVSRCAGAGLLFGNGPPRAIRSGAARETRLRWLDRSGYDASQTRALLEWQPLLEPQDPPDLLTVTTDHGAEATRMRQSGPFSGILTAPERKAIKEALKTSWLQGTR